MRTPVLLLALLAATPAVAQPPRTPPSAAQDRQAQIEAFQQSCRAGVQRTDKGESPRVRKLGEAARARHERAVLRNIYGCPVPVIVNEDVETRDGPNPNLRF